MQAQKWNYEKQKYEPHVLPSDWRCTSCSSDMTKIISCAQCGKSLQYGDCFASREIHTRFGFGFMVCRDCYEDEFRREREYRH